MHAIILIDEERNVWMITIGCLVLGTLSGLAVVDVDISRVKVEVIPASSHGTEITPDTRAKIRCNMIAITVST